MGERRRPTSTGGREATRGHIAGDVALAVGRPDTAAPCGFAWRRLTELARLETGHTPSRRISAYWDGDLPWIGIRDATSNHGRVISETTERITEAGEVNSSTRLLPANTVCLSRTASVGYVVVMGVPMCTSQDFVNWVCGPDLDWRYLKYILQAEKQAFLRFASGTTHQTIYFPEVKAFHVLVPAIDEQRAIAAVLGALDDKIESNRRIWNLRRELAQAEYRRVRASAPEVVALGSLYEPGLSGVWGEDAETESASVRTVCLRGRDLEDFVAGARCVAPTRFITNRQLASRKPEPGEIWTAGSGSLGPTLLITGDVLAHWDEPLTYSNFVKRLVPIGRHGLEAVAFLAVLDAWDRGDFTNFRTGTAMPNLDVDALLRGVDVPKLAPTAAVDVQGLVELALHPRLLAEKATLAELRNALLPELLSGRMRVRDAEAIAEEVA